MNLHKTLVCSILFLLLAVSCSKDKSLTQNELDSSVIIQMKASDFEDESLSKSLLSPSSSGTSFAWDKNDIVGVYSTSKGLTNFFIDKNSVSSDGCTANFNGAGFSLLPNSQYYAFYPYSAKALDKTCISVNYIGQKMDDNGDFNSLGNYDYMYSSGMSDEENHLSFSFIHIGCVVEVNIKVPETSYYTNIMLELENPSSDNYIIKDGTIDITEPNPIIKPNTYQSDTPLSVKLGTSGILVQKNEILTAYFMMPPQDLEGKKIEFRLIDADQNWYKSIINGKNMRAGYTYHYNINTQNEGFSGHGQGLPNDNHYAELIDYYTHKKNYAYVWLTSDDRFLYSTGLFGIRKFNYEYDASLSLVLESTAGLRETQCGRVMVVNEDLIYLGVRQNTSGKIEKYSPEVSFFFENNINSINTSTHISNNKTLNTFVKNLRLKSVSKNDVDEFLIYKAKNENDVYKNVVQLRKGGVCVCNLYREVYSTESEALLMLPSKFTNSNGDYIEMDWNVITQSKVSIKNLVLENCGEFDSFEISGSATFDETGTGNPNRGGHCALFKTQSSGNNKAVVKYGKNGEGGFISLMINSSKVPSNDVVIPLMSSGNSYVASIVLKPQGNGIRFCLQLDDKTYMSDQIFRTKEWYNLQIKLTPSTASLSIREKECGSWTNLITVEDNSVDAVFDALCLGIITTANDVELLVDDYYYNSKDLVNVSYVNGALIVIDKNDLSVINKYSLDFKVCGMAKCRNRLVVNCLNGFNVYNIDNPTTPKLIYTHRPKTFTEYHGVGTFEANGRLYAISCIYTKGFTIIDLTDANDIKILNTFDFSSILVDGESIQGHCYSFNVVVDYPYAYATIASTNDYCNTAKDHRGVVAIDLHDVNNPQLSFVEIPQNRLSRFTNTDQTPTQITKVGDCIFLNNREYGVEVFYMDAEKKLSYGSHITMPEESSSNAICATPDGGLFIGDDSKNGSSRNIYYYRWW